MPASCRPTPMTGTTSSIWRDASQGQSRRLPARHMEGARSLPWPILKRMPGASVDRFGESEAAIQAEPFSGVAVPLETEAVAADPVEASEGGVELLAEIFREARTGNAE